MEERIMREFCSIATSTTKTALTSAISVYHELYSLTPTLTTNDFIIKYSSVISGSYTISADPNLGRCSVKHMLSVGTCTPYHIPLPSQWTDIPLHAN